MRHRSRRIIDFASSAAEWSDGPGRTTDGTRQPLGLTGRVTVVYRGRRQGLRRGEDVLVQAAVGVRELAQIEAVADDGCRRGWAA